MQRSKKLIVGKHNGYQLNTFSNVYPNPIENISINLYTGTSLDSHSTLFECKISEYIGYKNNIGLEQSQLRRKRSNSLDSKKHIGIDEYNNCDYKFNCAKDSKQNKSKSISKFKKIIKSSNYNLENLPNHDNKNISDSSDDDFERASMLLMQKNEDIFYFEP